MRHGKAVAMVRKHRLRPIYRQKVQVQWFHNIEKAHFFAKITFFGHSRFFQVHGLQGLLQPSEVHASGVGDLQHPQLAPCWSYSGKHFGFIINPCKRYRFRQSFPKLSSVFPCLFFLFGPPFFFSISVLCKAFKQSLKALIAERGASPAQLRNLDSRGWRGAVGTGGWGRLCRSTQLRPS